MEEIKRFLFLILSWLYLIVVVLSSPVFISLLMIVFYQYYKAKGREMGFVNFYQHFVQNGFGDYADYDKIFYLSCLLSAMLYYSIYLLIA